MKDPIIKYINENRDEFDNDIPDQMAWDNIHKELHPEKKKKGGYIWFKAAAVVAVLFGTYLFVNNSFDGQGEELTEAEGFYLNEEEKQAIIQKQRSEQLTKTVDAGIVNPTALDKFSKSQAGRVVIPLPGKKNAKSEVKNITAVSGEFELSLYENSNLQTLHNVQINTDVAELSISDQSFGFSTNSRVVIAEDNLYRSNYSVANQGLSKDLIQSNSGYFGTNYQTAPYEQQETTGGLILVNPGYYYEQYQEFEENKFINPLDEALSTFSIDVDAAGYSNLRRYINDGYLPTKDVVKLEEMVNYFDYKLPQPTGEHPFSITTELGNCPWNKENKLLQICIKGKEIEKVNLPTNNLVFLLDVSGSMDTPDKLGLVKKGFKLLVNEMRPEDKVSIVVYAGAAGVVLPPTSGTKKDIILSALNNLTAGGSTAGGQGIEMAYKLAEKNLDKDGNNRIILATDGDFNVGMSGDDELVKLIEEKRKTGISLSVMGFGTGNLNNSMMEKVADNGNGNYSYIDNVMEAKKVFVTEMGGTLFTIAKDVKLQLEFNPSAVKSYRLLGYENRMLAPEDFNDDLKDAGELGAGHCVIALYELVPADDSKTVGESADLKYQSKTIVKNADNANDLVTIKFRYKEPNGTKSKLITKVVTNRMMPFNSYNFKFASSVAEFGLIIRDSEFKADANMDNLIDRARNSKGTDLNGYRSEFVNLAEKAQMLLDDYLVNYKDQ